MISSGNCTFIKIFNNSNSLNTFIKMNKIFSYAIILSLFAFLPSCGNSGDSKNNTEHNEDTHNHDHDHECDGHDHDHDSEVPHDHSHDHDSDHECEGHDHDHDHGHDHSQSGEAVEGEGSVIMFSDEQAQNILDFKVEEVRKQEFYQILKTSGQILSAPGDEVQIAATMSGIASISNPKLVEGFAVNSGQQLFSISGQNLSENNSSSRIIEARAIMNNAKMEYERASELVKEKIISQKEFQQAQLAYEQAELNYKTFTAGMSGSGKTIFTPIKGYIKNLYVQPGQYVDVGQILATVTQNKRLILRADVSQRYLPLIKNIKTASFTTPYDNTTYELTELEGNLLSIGRSSGGNSYYTPVNFEFDNKGNIIEGSFVEVYLKSSPVANAIVLPITALIEEQGHFFVYVRHEHEGEYIKREVMIGASDGINRQILKGLNVGEKVVTRGAYAVKLASLSNAMPEHSHSH